MAESKNGFSIPRGWGDLLSIALLFSLVIGLLGWGLKLESELNTLRNQFIGVQSKVDSGILPRADERLDNLENRVHRLENSHDE